MSLPAAMVTYSADQIPVGKCIKALPADGPESIECRTRIRHTTHRLFSRILAADSPDRKQASTSILPPARAALSDLESPMAPAAADSTAAVGRTEAVAIAKMCQRRAGFNPG
jgi:hypothetical protein